MIYQYLKNKLIILCKTPKYFIVNATMELLLIKPIKHNLNIFIEKGMSFKEITNEIINKNYHNTLSHQINNKTLKHLFENIFYYSLVECFF